MGIDKSLNGFLKQFEKNLIDEVSADLSYIGMTESGVETSDAKWLIAKVEKTGNVTSITYAGGYGNKENIWDNRAGLTYTN